MVDFYQGVRRVELLTYELNVLYDILISFNEAEIKDCFLFHHPLFPASNSNMYKREACSPVAGYHESALIRFC